MPHSPKVAPPPPPPLQSIISIRLITRRHAQRNCAGALMCRCVFVPSKQQPLDRDCPSRSMSCEGKPTGFGRPAFFDNRSIGWVNQIKWAIAATAGTRRKTSAVDHGQSLLAFRTLVYSGPRAGVSVGRHIIPPRIPATVVGIRTYRRTPVRSGIKNVNLVTSQTCIYQ